MERESRTLEYKREMIDYKTIAHTVVAFANGDGGIIIIGVDDKKRNVIGLPPTEIDTLLERIPVSLADRIQPALFPQTYEKTIDGKEVLVIQVYPGTQKPYFVSAEGMEKGVYIRVGAHTRRASGEVLEDLRLLRSRMGYDEQILSTCPINEMDFGRLSHSMKSEKSLLSLEVVRTDPFSGKSHATRGGILMFHSTPEKYVPEAFVICSRMRGNQGRDTIESHEITGSLPDQLELAIAQLETWLGVNPQLNGVRYANTQLALPREALREAVANALFHRQYSIPGPIKIALYADRLEIFSPGHFAGPFIPDSLGDGTSYIRNKVIALVARRLGLIEKRGTGIKLIFDSMKDRQLLPQFTEGAGWFKTILNLTAQVENLGQTPENQILALLESSAEISNSMVCKKLSVSKVTGALYLNNLIKKGRLKRIGKGPTTRYTVTGY